MNRKKTPFDRWFGFALILYAFVSPVSISATNIALGLIYFPGLILIWKTRGKLRLTYQKEITALFFVTFVWGAFCTLLSGNFIIREMFYDMWEYSPIILFPLFLSAAGIRKEKVLMALFISSSIVSVLGILQYFIPAIIYPFPRQLVDTRFRGFFSHPLHTGGFYSIVTLIAFALILFWQCDKRMKSFLFLVFFFNMTAVILSMSRSYYISTIFIILVLLFVKNWRGMIYGAIVFSILFAVILSFHNPINTKIRTLTDPDFSSNKERKYIWESAIEMTKEHPVFGVGKGNWKKEAKHTYFPRIEQKYKYKLPDLGHAHNTYLTWSSETGILGLTLSLSFWLIVAWSLYSKLPNLKSGTLELALTIGTLAGQGNLFLAGLFENNFGTAVILLLISMLIGLSSLKTPLDTNRQG